MLTLVLGGARSGKSRYGQSLCDSSSGVIYIATAVNDANDLEMRERIGRHRADRSAEWQTVEEPLHLSRAVLEAPVEANLLIDCVTLWISNLMWEFREKPGAEQEKLILAEVDELIEAVSFPYRRPGEGFAFREFARRHGDFAIVACAAVATEKHVRLAVGGVADRAVMREFAADSDLDDALHDFAAELDARDDLHATAGYRRDLVRKIGAQTIAEAKCRA